MKRWFDVEMPMPTLSQLINFPPRLGQHSSAIWVTTGSQNNATEIIESNTFPSQQY